MSKGGGAVLGPASKFQEDYLNSDARILVVGGEFAPPFKTPLIR